MENNTVNTVNTSARNTKRPCRLWSITINNPSEDDRRELEQLKESLIEYGWQDEMGEDGTLHIQGYIYFKNARSFSAIKKKLPRAHIEPGKNINALRNYCQKNDTAVGNRESNRVVPKEKDPMRILSKDPMDGLTPYEWQQGLLDLVEQEPDKRRIYWLYDEVGCSGKTMICGSLVYRRDDVLYVSGSSSDMKYTIAQYLIDRSKSPRMVLIDIPRSQDSKYVSYGGIESIKNGLFFNTKYKSGMCQFDPPHVVIFSNCLPNLEVFSEDRYMIYQIEKENHWLVDIDELKDKAKEEQQAFIRLQRILN